MHGVCMAAWTLVAVSNRCLLKNYQEPIWIQVTSDTPDTAEFASATSPCGKQPQPPQTEGLWSPSCHTPALHRQRVKLEASQSTIVLPIAEESVSSWTLGGTSCSTPVVGRAWSCLQLLVTGTRTASRANHRLLYTSVTQSHSEQIPTGLSSLPHLDHRGNFWHVPPPCLYVTQAWFGFESAALLQSIELEALGLTRDQLCS